MANALRDAALEYEAAGYSVIPLKPKDKIPLIPSWTEFQTARADREQIGIWWRNWKDANIGIVTGAVSGVVVIDCDSPEAATDLKPMLGDMSAVGVAATGKGFHLYYSHSDGIFPNKAGVKPQIDFRGDGGYVVAPPSVHSSGKHYEWAKPINGHLRELPAEFVAAMSAPAQNGTKPAFDTAGALAGIPEGQRDQGVFKLACKLRGADVPYEMALDLCETAAANCVPKFLNARRKVDQAYKYAPGHSEDAKQQVNGVELDFWPTPVSMRDFLATEDDESERWIWDRLVPYGEVAMLCGEPRSGKTTLALNLALAVSQGAPFLGRRTTKTKCLYVSIDNSRRDMKSVCSQIHLVENDNLCIHVGKVPARATDWVLDMAVKTSSKLVIIDTLERFFESSDINKPDFAKAMVPLDLEAKRIGITPLYVHHATAKPGLGARVGSLFMGHTTVKAMTPYYLELVRFGERRHRLLSSDLRSGENLDSTYIKLDRATGWAILGGRLEDAMIDDYKDRVLAFLRDNGPATREQIRQAVEGRKQLVNIATTALVDAGTLERVDPEVNTGKPHHPEILTLAAQLVTRDFYEPTNAD
jgi:hypothetical protein